MKLHHFVSLAALSLVLQACGDGGSGGVASTPAPIPASAPAPAPSPSPSPAIGRTPLPPTPATTSGTYRGFAVYTSFDMSKLETERDANGGILRTVGTPETTAPLQVAPQGSIGLAIDAATRTYTLTVDAGPYRFPHGSMTMPASAELGYTRNNSQFQGSPAADVASGDMLASTVPAGTAANGALQAVTSFLRLCNAGQSNGSPRYVSVAQWGQFYQENASGAPSPQNFRPTKETSGFLVFGQRTAAGDMPATGKATYALHSLINPPSSDEGGNVFDTLGTTELSVDFATKALSGRHSRTDAYDTFETDEEGYTIVDDDGNGKVIGHTDLTILATGSTTVASDGGFNLTLSGTGKVHATEAGKPAIADIVKPVTGSLTGAFFGPQAAEVGGIATLPSISADGTVTQGFFDFAGMRTVP